LRTPAFLEELGYGRPPEDELMVHLAYACQPLRTPPGAVDEHLIAIFPEAGRPRMFGLVENENRSWMFGVGAMAGLEPPGERDDMIAFAADFAPAHVLDAIRAAEPLGEVGHHRVPSNRWRRYNKMRRLPQGLLALGDAVCSFNPIYGQGMVVAAIEAITLRDCLRRGQHDLPRRFFSAGAKHIRLAWQTAVGADSALPEVGGQQPISMRISNAYLEWVLIAAERDIAVAQRFMRVTGMLDTPTQLLRPAFMFRVVRANLRPRDTGPRQPKPATALAA
jgi:2-polyprenyl-6-methoxyphenol hydroxylase-like FAD-dependent oxidoreductase